jgi:hypothetical protein
MNGRRKEAGSSPGRTPSPQKATPPILQNKGASLLKNWSKSWLKRLSSRPLKEPARHLYLINNNTAESELHVLCAFRHSCSVRDSSSRSGFRWRWRLLLSSDCIFECKYTITKSANVDEDDLRMTKEMRHRSSSSQIISERDDRLVCPSMTSQSGSCLSAEKFPVETYFWFCSCSIENEKNCGSKNRNGRMFVRIFAILVEARRACFDCISDEKIEEMEDNLLPCVRNELSVFLFFWWSIAMFV